MKYEIRIAEVFILQIGDVRKYDQGHPVGGRALLTLT